MQRKWVFYIPVVGLIIITVLLYIPDIISLLPGQEQLPIIDSRDKIDIMLTLAIAFFAAVEGYSTYTQVVIANERNRAEDLRNELEKAYGPLYALLNSAELPITDDKKIRITEVDKVELDEIMARFPFIFPSGIYDLWREKVQPVQYHKGIPLEFRDKINKEYSERVKKYRDLLNRE